MPPGQSRRREMTAERLRRDAGTVGEGAAPLAAALLGDGAGTEQALRSCRRLLRLEGTCGRERLDAACARAMSIGSPKVSSMEDAAVRPQRKYADAGDDGPALI